MFIPPRSGRGLDWGKRALIESGKGTIYRSSCLGVAGQASHHISQHARQLSQDARYLQNESVSRRLDVETLKLTIGTVVDRSAVLLNQLVVYRLVIAGVGITEPPNAGNLKTALEEIRGHSHNS